MADNAPTKRARSDSTGSSHGHKRQVIQDNNGNIGYAPQQFDNGIEPYVPGGALQASLSQAPASAGLPEAPLAAAEAANQSQSQPQQQADPRASMTAPMISMRALIVTQDASVIIGRGGAHIREIREKSGAKVDVTPQVPGNPERILNISGPLDAVSKVSRKFAISIFNLAEVGFKAFGLIVRRINDEPYDSPSVPGSRAVTVRYTTLIFLQ